jgi:ribonuclease HII
MIMKDFDNRYICGNVRLLAGCDEAGRGPLAGPVVAASVVFAPETFIDGINDSKKLSEKKREALYPEIIEKAVAWKICEIDNNVIDKINILQASLLAMKQACEGLIVSPELILIDGNKTFQYPVKTEAIVKGDSKSFSIAAASILAKVRRDEIMRDLDKLYPEYLWSKNKGYPTKEHYEAIRRCGITPLHRKTFLKSFEL